MPEFSFLGVKYSFYSVETFRNNFYYLELKQFEIVTKISSIYSVIVLMSIHNHHKSSVF